MPYTPADARRHNKKAKTPRLQRMWAAVWNGEFERHGDEGRAFAAANAAIDRAAKGRRKKS